MKKDLFAILSKENTEDDIIGSCIIWKRCLNSDGYPRANIEGNENAKVHRIVYELYNPEEDISEKVIRHKCDNPKCVNPDHLISGTHTDNMMDRDLRERHGKAKLSHMEVKAIRDLWETRKYKQKELAAMFNVNHRTVSSIICRTHFKHVV